MRKPLIPFKEPRKTAEQNIVNILKPSLIDADFNLNNQAMRERRAAVFIGQHWILVGIISVLIGAMFLTIPIWKKNRYTAILKEHRELQVQLKILRSQNLLLVKAIEVQSSRVVIDSLARLHLGMTLGDTPIQLEVQ
jgi:hypothetical protein